MSKRNARQIAIQEIQHFICTTSAFNQTLGEAGLESTSILRERVAVGLESLQDQLDQAMEYADEAALSVREWIAQHPWAAIGIAGGIGMALGCTAAADRSRYAEVSDRAGPRAVAKQAKARIAGPARVQIGYRE